MDKLEEKSKIVEEKEVNEPNEKCQNEAMQNERDLMERWSRINYASPIGVNCWDVNLNYLDGNEMGYKMFGYASKEEWDKNWRKNMPEIQPDGVPSVKKFADSVEKAILEGSSRMEWLHYTKDGEHLPLDIVLSRQEYGDDFMVVAYLQDLRPLREADAKIQEAIKRERDVILRQQQIYDASPFPASLWNENQQIIACNKAMVKLLGMSDKDEYTERFFEFVPEFQPDGTRTIDKVAEISEETNKKGFCRSAFTHLSAENEIVPCDIIAVKIELDSETLHAVYVQDLRPMLDATAKLQESEKRTRDMIDACPLAVSLYDTDWRELSCNPAAIKMFGLDEKYEFGKKTDSFMQEIQPCGRHRDEVDAQLHKSLMETGYANAEIVCLKADGKPLILETAYVRLDYSDHSLFASYCRDLTEEKAIREREREVNELNEIFMKNAPLVMNIWDDTITLIATTPQVVEMFEVDSMEQYIEGFYDLSPEYQPCGTSSRELSAKLLSQALDSGYARFEWMHQKLNGEPIPTDVILHRFVRDGKPFLATFAIDLRPAKAMQEKAAMELAQHRMTAMLNASPLACFVLSANFEVLELNQEAINLFGAKGKQDFIENFIRSAPKYQLDGEPSIKKMSDMMESSDENIKTEWLAQTFQGERFPCELYATKFFVDGAKMVIVYMRDLRDFYAYQEMNKRIQIMFDTTPLIIEYWDENYIPIDCNKATLDFYEQSKEEYEQHLEKIRYNPIISESVGGYHRSGWDANIEKIFETGHGRFDWMEPKPDGSIVPLEVEGNRVIFNNEPIVITYSKDVTQLRILQKEQEELLQKLEAASNAKSKFLSNMSHEIRTPMSAIIGMTGIAKNTGDIDRKNDSLVKIEKASNHLLSIINQILDISKIEAEQFKLDSRTFNFVKVVDEVINVISVSIEEKRLDLDVNLDKNIPKYIVSDETRLAQVLTNLLINAVKFTPEGGKVSLTTKFLPDAVMRVEVADTGIGIPKGLNSDLFDAFVQVEMSATRSFAGTGLGLPISKKIIEMMGGKIWYESEPGEGTCFIFEIPVVTGSSVEEDSPAKYTEGMELGQYKDYTVLIAEDMEINREIVSALLEPTGIKIECATDGEQAIQMFRDNSERYDLILMDVQMPKMDGLAATRQLRALGTEKAIRVPIVAMTANVFSEDVKSCLEAGMNDHLSKPLDLGQIISKLRLYLPPK